MFGNTTRSATVVFRFFFDTLAKFHIKRHTRFAYVARIVPVCACRRGGDSTVGLHRTLAVSFGDFQPPCRARRARDCAPYHARFLADQFKAARRRFSVLSPVTDAIGRIRRCQRSTCGTAALPAPRRRRKINMQGNHPSNAWNDSKTAVLRQLPRQAITLKRLSPPRFWAMNHAPISSGKRIGQSATSGATYFKIAVKSRILAEFVTNAPLRIEDEDWLLDRITDDSHCTRKTGIARDKTIVRFLFIESARASVSRSPAPPPRKLAG